MDLKKFQFGQDMRKDLGLDSLNITVLLTEVEREFTTVFEDRLFESVRTLEELVWVLQKDGQLI